MKKRGALADSQKRISCLQTSNSVTGNFLLGEPIQATPDYEELDASQNCEGLQEAEQVSTKFEFSNAAPLKAILKFTKCKPPHSGGSPSIPKSFSLKGLSQMVTGESSNAQGQIQSSRTVLG
jgi:hypothetical protein